MSHFSFLISHSCINNSDIELFGGLVNKIPTSVLTENKTTLSIPEKLKDCVRLITNYNQMQDNTLMYFMINTMTRKN